jgi:hypothetical protein
MLMQSDRGMKSQISHLTGVHIPIKANFPTKWLKDNHHGTIARETPHFLLTEDLNCIYLYVVKTVTIMQQGSFMLCLLAELNCLFCFVLFCSVLFSTTSFFKRYPLNCS